jgi:PAS domain-containing protein
VQFNARANELLGRPPDAPDITDQDLLAAIHPDDRDAVARADAQALAGDAIIDAVVRCLRPDGTACTLMTQRVAERGAQGRAIALVGVALDITA